MPMILFINLCFSIINTILLSLKQMQKSIFQSQVTEIKDSFAETFGRGCLIKYKEPSFSQRNKFQLEKMNGDKGGRYHQTYYQKHRATNMNDEISFDKKQVYDVSKYTNRSIKDFEKIDEINNKICGLIKSISSSCHKKTPIQMKYDHKERDSSKKGHIIPNNYTASKTVHMDHVTTQKKKNHGIERGYIQSKLVDFNVPKKQQEKPSQSKFDWQLQAKNTNSVNNEGYVDLNDRIKKINDKITNYQNKIKGNIKEANDQKQIPFRQRKDFGNMNWTPSKQLKKEVIPKLTQNRMRYINENQNLEDFKKQIYPPQAKKIDKNQVFSRKTGFFNEKYAKHQENYIKRQQHKQIDQHKKISKQMNREQRKPSVQNKRSTKNQINPKHFINGQLLSYKTQFLKELVKQIALDQDFRHAKHMFGGIQGLFDEAANGINQKQKWNNLQKQLKNQGFNLPLSQVKEIFMPRDDEIDPFMSVSHSHEQLVHGLIYSYRCCQRNWNQNMYHSWSLWELKQSKFTIQNLDQSRRGNITLEDLTFYLNTQLDGNYRNRDLMLIFNRFKGSKAKGKDDETGIKFKDVIDKLLTV